MLRLPAGVNTYRMNERVAFIFPSPVTSFTRCAPSLGKSTFSLDMKHPFLCNEIWRGPSWIVYRVAARLHAGGETWACRAGLVPSNIQISTPVDIMTVLRKTRCLSHDLFLKNVSWQNTQETLDPCLHCACLALADPAVTLVWSQINHHNIAKAARWHAKVICMSEKWKLVGASQINYFQLLM